MQHPNHSELPKQGFSSVEPLWEHFGVAEVYPQSITDEARAISTTVFNPDVSARFEESEHGKSSDDGHPENGKNFPLWKKIILVTGEFLAVVGTILFWLPIPFGIATLTLSIGIIGIAVGPRHAKQHVKRIFHIISTPVRWFLNTPPIRSFVQTMKDGTWAEKWGPLFEAQLKKLRAWFRSKLPKKKEKAKRKITTAPAL